MILFTQSVDMAGQNAPFSVQINIHIKLVLIFFNLAKVLFNYMSNSGKDSTNDQGNIM